jgi:hypothetical protein
MTKAFSKDHEQSRGTNLAPGDINPSTDAISFEDFIHDLRQPLGVIESLSFFLELTSTNSTNSGPHLRKIRVMVHQAHRILEAALLAQSKLIINTSGNTEPENQQSGD